jgi:hypothetical protein
VSNDALAVVGVDGLTPEWLTEALAPTIGGAKVTSVDAVPVGTGQMADSVRLVLGYDVDGAGPVSVVAKLAAADPTSRATAIALRSYELEVRFYRELAPGLPVRAPRCHHTGYDATTGDVVLLLEDLAPARQGDQLAGCTPDQAALAVEELPRLHAPRWGDPGLASLEWLHGDPATSAAFGAQLISSLFVGFRDRYAERLDADVLALAEALIQRLLDYLSHRPEPWTITHGDYRLDNLLFGASDPDGGAATRVAVVDWQTVSHGPGLADLSYFIGAGLVPDDRRAHEDELVRSYHAAMGAAGVDLSWNDCWEGYRRYTFAGLIMAIAASMLVEQTDRGDDMFVTMAQRHGRHALDLDALAMIP